MGTVKRRWHGSVLIILFSAAMLASLSACAGGSPTETIYKPPTPANPFLAATQTPPGFVPTPLAPACVDSLTYIEDLTIPDGMIVTPGRLLDKQWRVQNSGTCNWDGRYRLRLTYGEALGAAPEQALYPARAGSELILRIRYTAPAEGGIYRSEWQAYAPNGQAFGDPVFIEITVVVP